MAVNTQTINVDLNTGKNIPTAYTHQNDTTRQFVFNVFNNGTPFALTNYTAKFSFVSAKTHGGYYVITGSNMVSGTVSGNTVTVTLPAIYSQVAGAGLLTMILTSSNATIRPVNIRLVVQKSADGDDVVAGASDFPTTLAEIVGGWITENGSSMVSAWASENGALIMSSETNTWMNSNADEIIENKANAWLDTNGDELVSEYVSAELGEVNFANQVLDISCDIDRYISYTGAHTNQTANKEKRTDYIPFGETSFLSVEMDSENSLNYWYRMAFYDENKTFMTYKEETINGVSSYKNKIPSIKGCAYVRFSARTYDAVDIKLTAYHAITQNEVITDSKYDISNAYTSDGDSILKSSSFNNVDWVDGYIDTGGKKLITPSNAEMTFINFIPVEEGKTYTLSNSNPNWTSTWVGMAFYSSRDFDMISRPTKKTTGSSFSFTAPQNAKFAIISSRNMTGYYQTATLEVT